MRLLKGTLLLLGVVAVMASCRDKEPDMTLVQETWYREYLINRIQADDVWDLTIVQDDETSYVVLEYSAFLQEYMRIDQSDGAFRFYLTSHPHLPNNTVLKATIHTPHLYALNLNKAATAVIDGAFQGDIDVTLESGCFCKGGSFTGTTGSLKLRSNAQMVDFNVNATRCDVLVEGSSTFKGTLTASEELTIAMLDDARLTNYGGSAAKVQAGLQGNCSLNLLETEVDRMEIDSRSSEAFVNVSEVLGGSLADTSILYFQRHPGLVLNLAVDTTSFLSPLNTKF